MFRSLCIHSALLATVVSSIPAFALAAKPTFLILEDLPEQYLTIPRSISADGSTIVGSSQSNLGGEAFVWTRAEGMQRLPATELGRPYTAWDVSADGSTIVGEMETSTGSQAFRWSREAGYDLFAPQFAGLNAEAHAVSADGRVIVGHAYSAQQAYFAFIWTAESGVQLLGDLPGGENYAEVRDITADGTTVVGISASALGNEAFRWTRDGGMQGLGILPTESTEVYSEAYVVSADGSVIAANSSSTGFTSQQAAKWDAANGLVGIGERLPGMFYWSEAHGITADGSIIVGQHYTENVDGAFIWDAQHGLRSLSKELGAKYGLAEEIGDFRLGSAQAISADGRVITGFGGNVFEDAWVAIVPEPSASVLGTTTMLLGGMAVRRRSRSS